MDDLRIFLSPADYIDSDHPAVAARTAETAAGASGPVEVARRLYLFVRDAIRYDPYVDYTDPETFRASSVLAAGRGYCVGKASLYCALARAAGIPARLGLADVRNHLATPKLLETVGTDVFAFHGVRRALPGGRLDQGDADLQRHPVPEARRLTPRLRRTRRRAAPGLRRRGPALHDL